MKKFLVCMLLAGLMMPVVAQEKLSLEKIKKERIFHVREADDLGISTQTAFPINSKGTLVDVDGWTYSGTTKRYDRQTQGSVYPMTRIHDDGFIGSTWTNEDNTPFPGSSTPLRGVGYAFSTDGGATWSTPDLRAGGIPLYWPSYAQWGKNGEIILARSADTYEHQGVQILNGLVLLTRENKGVGEWKITPVPYPEGLSPNANYVMAWARMATSGNNHQYIHIMTPIRTPATEHPTYYFRTQDGGETWDVPGKLISEVVGHEWDKYMDGYTDGINFTVQENALACCFMSMGSDGYVLKSSDNGDTWTSIKFFDSPVKRCLYPIDYDDTIYMPVQGCVALDNDGKVHIAFGAVMVANSETTVGYFSGFLTSFLSYWNEYMAPIDGESYVVHEIDLIWDEYFDWPSSEEGRYYVNSTIPKMPVIGFYTPTLDEHIFTVDANIIREWGGSSYGPSGGFSFAQMEFDADNKLHLAYLGFLDGGSDGDRWLRHPYYISTEDNGNNWTQTEYLVNTADLIDREFAYLTLAGILDDKMYLMV
jgi:hypothetical protein